MDLLERENVERLESIANSLNAAHALEHEMNQILAEDGLRLNLWRIMHALATTPGMLMGELASRLTIPAATVSRLIDELTDGAIVFRRPAPDDRRKAVVYLSRAGYERLERASALFAPRLAHLSSVMPSAV
ncbi:MarR family winged helix-turn-helix transcriptional regulator [Pseudarthrobacter sp. NPDC058329]|uniref:MarR family winged helix-turn-helix transcriptional regulator n=1 Tax=Pseudarthrobacter sp. NPDC058329 TaxID=3346448 RepID=UPI0036DDC4DD